MERKGSITVFLALILSLMLSLVCTSIESVRMAAARTQILNSLDIGLFSLFGQFDKTLFQEFDLFFLDGSCGGGTLNFASVYDNMEAYIKPVLKQNSQKLSLEQGGFTGYRLATDDEGEVFYHQVVQYMRDTLGSQGVQLLLEKLRSNETNMKKAEQAGTEAEKRNSLESYEAEMNSAAQNSQAAQAEAEKKAEETGNGALSGISPEFTDGQRPAEVANPIHTIRQIRKMGILDLVLPAGTVVSDQSVSKKTLVSGRKLQQGMTMPDERTVDSSYSSRVLFMQYMVENLGDFRQPASQGLKYQTEYLIQGKLNDRDNLTGIAKKLLLIREGVNFTYLLADSTKRMQAETLALTIASTFLLPPAAAVIEAALLLCWSFAESILDVRELFAGGKVPLVKSAESWQLSLGNLPYLLEGLDTLRHGTDEGMDYEEYLQVMMLTQNKANLLKRGMDMIEASVRSKSGRENFRLDSCIEAVEVSMDVKANRRKVFTVTKQYCYN